MTPVLPEHDQSSEMGPKSHTTITSTGNEAPLIYTAGHSRPPHAKIRTGAVWSSKAGHSLHRLAGYFGTREEKSHKNLWKSAKWLVVVGIPSGLKSERKRWNLKSRFRGTLKEASEKNNALRRLKPRF
ncbi:hypothetical protein AVEN_201680-1 [Araneus ventricosus]|uniref:Uncharacterized protein n=1 Tax=Araneus ventricosus TaxID=182803 RepID=A0A4Y2F701_ARAVE|nr:hypothetical protein AVEN_201680-1 [Araneus ventricosus]